ncbi:MAG: 16S rRNA (uracil(1498)-N(3))-methyltransferase [candidate division KSB1 bacterium]|nr:16S rRNA (uracil(1498)-N(3))-methyltransferase [candidate division KSB1 bacterium]MDZ7300967.1 16S rRNA (uracil(1498)-N(3))-methyltransferase [candidate division KSB1 bacterium]MDZ7310355.1 16S rRNA (uracil(1498)-N(3))-methyltransferase [candidate division KSB1 bacterium]
MSRREFFYSPSDDFTTGMITLGGDEHVHLARVLHHQVGDRVTVVDGAGLAAECEIIEIGRTVTRLRIIKKNRRLGEPFVHLTLAQAVLKGHRFDWLIEKATEIGVSAFIPLLCERSEARPSPAKAERWHRLALAAMKQSCRSVCPTVSEPVMFGALCRRASSLPAAFSAGHSGRLREFDFVLLAHEGSGDPLMQLASRPLKPRIGLVMIGPEGGFSDSELQIARDAGITFWGLGPRRLRAETAGLVAAMKILATFGELS